LKFKKKAPIFPDTASDWGIKQIIIKYMQRKSMYLNAVIFIY